MYLGFDCLFVMRLYCSLLHVMLDFCNHCACFAKKIINYYYYYYYYCLLIIVYCYLQRVAFGNVKLLFLVLFYLTSLCVCIFS